MTGDALTGFAAGTRIATLSGVLAVEDLRASQPIRAAFGGLASVTWVGRIDVDDAALSPVRIRAGAFGPKAPERDLVLSRDYAVFVPDPSGRSDGTLIPVGHLVNGTTVTIEPPGRATYYRVEVNPHDVVLANGLMVESGRPGTERGKFECVSMLVTFPHAANTALDASAAPCVPVLETGPGLDVIRARLAELGGPAVPLAELAVAFAAPIPAPAASVEDTIVGEMAHLLPIAHESMPIVHEPPPAAHEPLLVVAEQPASVEIAQATSSTPRRLRRLDQYLAVFSEQEYLRRNGDVAESVAQDRFTCGLVHYLTNGFNERRAVCAFDEGAYARRHPTAAAEVARGDYGDLLHHYVEVGRRQGFPLTEVATQAAATP